MEPTFPQGSKVEADLLAYIDSGPKRFDVVLFIPTQHQDAIFIFRVLALPGEHIDLNSGTLLIDSVEIEIPNDIRYNSLAGTYKAEFNNFTLSENEFFLVGDNVGRANDSRFLGPITIDQIIGKVTRIVEGGVAESCPNLKTTYNKTFKFVPALADLHRTAAAQPPLN